MRGETEVISLIPLLLCGGINVRFFSTPADTGDLTLPLIFFLSYSSM